MAPGDNTVSHRHALYHLASHLVVNCAQTLYAVGNSFGSPLQGFCLVIVEVSAEPRGLSISDDPQLPTRVSDEMLVVADNDQTTSEIFCGIDQCVNTFHVQVVLCVWVTGGKVILIMRSDE